jgi:adenylosuccinate lyase
MPDSTILVDYMLNRLASVLQNLRLIPENIESNLQRSYGLYYSQRILLALVEKGLARQKAYEMVQAVAMQAWENQHSFPDLVRADEDLGQYLSSAELDQLFDPQYYLRYEDLIFNRVFQGPDHE